MVHECEFWNELSLIQAGFVFVWGRFSLILLCRIATGNIRVRSLPPLEVVVKQGLRSQSRLLFRKGILFGPVAFLNQIIHNRDLQSFRSVILEILL